MSETNIFGFTSDALPPTTRVLTFNGSEAISKLYAFEVYLLLPRADSDDLDLASVIGQRASLQLFHSDNTPRRAYHGVVTALELVHELPGDAVYRAVLSPKLWTLQLTRHSNVFVDQAIPDIIEGVLQDSGLSGDDYELRLTVRYPQYLHVCQYRESNFDFVCRWMEREGMYWYFDHTGEVEKLIITDAASRQEPMGDGPVGFVAGHGQNNAAVEALQGFTVRHAMLPTSVGLRDYDYLRPRVEVLGTAPVASNGVGEINSFGDNVPSVGESRRIARVRAQEYLARQVLYHGSGRVFELQPGYFFELDAHPRAAFNQRYLAVELHHRGNNASADEATLALVGGDAAEVYRVDVAAIPAATQFRAESVTPMPRIYGVEFAVVDGSIDSDYAQIDEHGRYHVKIMFDENDARNGRASTRVRMLQPHGGNPEGFHFPLRKGTEVTLSFLGGDPDRPVISAVAPNADRPSPVIEANHTLNVIQTGATNRIEIEDAQGQEYIKLTTPHKKTMFHLGSPHNPTHNIQLQTDGNCRVELGTDWDIHAKGHLDEHIEKHVDEKYDLGQKSTVKGGLREEVFQASHKTTVTGTQTTEVSGKVTETHKGGHDITVSGGLRDEKYQTSHKTTVTGTQQTEVSGAVTETYKGGQTTNITGGLTITASEPINITAPVVETTSTSHKVNVLGVDMEIKGSSAETVIGAKNENVLGAKIEFLAALKSEVHVGAKIEAFLGIHLDFAAAIVLEAHAALNLHEVGGFTEYGGTFVVIKGNAMIDVVTPLLMVPAAAIVLV
jgi:type VI secretion system secreted protein VgrG